MATVSKKYHCSNTSKITLFDFYSSYQMPLFQNAERDGDENFIIDLDFPTGTRHPDDWILTGTALLCQKPIDGF